MAVVVDPPLFIPMLKTSDPRHQEYFDIKNWVVNGKAKFVIGGTQYKNELSRIESILKLLIELDKRNKIYRISDNSVDEDVVNLKRLEPSADFDDPHLVALIRLSHAKIICVNDPRSHKFLKRNDFYDNPKLRPKLYTGSRNKRLLNDSNLSGICYR